VNSVGGATGTRRGRGLPVLIAAVAALVALALGGRVVAGCDAPPGSHPAAAASGGSGPSGSAAPGSTRSPAAGGQDPARYAGSVRRYAGAAGIHAQLLMAILYNEDYKPHDPSLERAWQRLDPNAAFGVANMHRGTFDDTKRGRDFADRDWTELPDDPDLALEAAAWYLHDLAADLPSSWPAKYTKDELLAMGYNAGPGAMRSYAQGGRPTASVQSYVDKLHANWDAAGRALG
jgi:Transglycosylase SLT domain